jgi:hypothetical protein
MSKLAKVFTIDGLVVDSEEEREIVELMIEARDERAKERRNRELRRAYDIQSELEYRERNWIVVPGFRMKEIQRLIDQRRVQAGEDFDSACEFVEHRVAEYGIEMLKREMGT